METKEQPKEITLVVKEEIRANVKGYFVDNSFLKEFEGKEQVQYLIRFLNDTVTDLQNLLNKTMSVFEITTKPEEKVESLD